LTLGRATINIEACGTCQACRHKLSSGNFHNSISR
jgi:hypothetical protein